jgi:hypothetical protein
MDAGERGRQATKRGRQAGGAPLVLHHPSANPFPRLRVDDHEFSARSSCGRLYEKSLERNSCRFASCLPREAGSESDVTDRAEI